MLIHIKLKHFRLNLFYFSLCSVSSLNAEKRPNPTEIKLQAADYTVYTRVAE